MSDKSALSVDRDDRLAEVLDAYLAAHEGGTPPDVDEFLARYPDLAGELRECVASLAFIRRAGNLSVAGDTPPEGEAVGGVLGDFRILGEVGKGGMGVVYEAEQISLRRRVALKVLPFAATMDPRHLQRFHNEARAAACLHHANIVPVYFVGCERSVHFYAMQFIEGKSLAELIATRRDDSASVVASAPRSRSLTERTRAIASETTQAVARDAAQYRRVAEWGIQAAEALEHAHSLGIVHRDIKPANLMIDGAGKLWVTDFGLARTATDAGLTMTGDVLGTLRYMSPEQALAKHGLVDHRSDIYSLGATMYELLTLRPVVDGKDREEILGKIAFDEPPSPRSLDRAIPTDLETIVLKAIAKDPAERYATAQELAEDLRFLLQDKPIQALRPSFVKRVRKYLRRHQAAAWSAGAGLAIAVVILSVSSLLLWQEKERVKLAIAEKETQSRIASEQAVSAEKQRLRAEANFGKALNGMTTLLENLDEKEWPQLVSVDQIHQSLRNKIEGFFEGFVAENKDEPLVRLEIGWAYQHLGVFYFRRGDIALAERYKRAALAFHEALAADYPNDWVHISMYAQSLYRLGTTLHFTGRLGEARNYFLQAGEQYRRQVRLKPNWQSFTSLARFLTSCPDEELRDAAEAVQSASQAVELADPLVYPESFVCWEILGSALYRNGDWQAAVDTLLDLFRRRGENSDSLFFLSMSYGKLGNRESARHYFDRGMQRLGRENYPSEITRRLGAEAAALLGIPEQPTTRAKKESSRKE
jgi:serine/threonine protein kinase